MPLGNLSFSEVVFPPMRRAIPGIALCCGLFAAGCLSRPAATSTNPPIQAQVGVVAPAKPDPLKQLVDGYLSWTKVNPEPLNMSPRIAALCIAPPRWNSALNPHDPKFFTVYVNSVGRTAMFGEKSTRFPIGSVIVKEKFNSLDAKHPELLTVMVKRATGYDPAHGDWEYFAVDGPTGKANQENIGRCQSCHEMNKA